MIIVFDLDDTLYPEFEFVKSGFIEVHSYLKLEYSIDNFFEKAWSKFLNGNRGFIFNEVLNELGYRGNIKQLVEILIDIYRSHSPSIELYEDAKWALENYSKKYKLALISDGYLQTQKNKVAKLNIERYFQKLYFTDFWGGEFWKPNPMVFEKVQNDFNLFGQDLVYIGDNLTKDFIGPNLLGWESIFVDRRTGIYSQSESPSNGSPKSIISSLFELPAIIK